MKRFLPAWILILLLLVIAAGCNDDNTVNSLPKSHDVYPVFHMKIDNGFTSYGVDSVLLTVEPDVGWESEIYSDSNGFIGALASGTYITRIDTLVEIDPDTQVPDTTYDTISVTYAFTPSTAYNFTFTRASDFNWVDSFRVVYAMSIDSTWTLLDTDSVRVSTQVETTIPFDTIVRLTRQIKTPSDTLNNTPDSVALIDFPVGYWFDTAFVLTNPQYEEDFPPDSTGFVTQSWAFWFAVDTFFKSRDSLLYCDVDSIVVRKDTFDQDNNGYVTYTLDTLYYFHSCPDYPTLRNKIYRTWGWTDYDTTIHAVIPDTAKSLIFVPDGSLQIVNHVTSLTHDAVIYFKDQSGTAPIDVLELDLTMPPVEVYPHYEIIIKDEGGK